MERLKTPILLIVYKRIETTRQVLAKIREARPYKLYLAANGANPQQPADKIKCEETRKIINEIDWPCEVITNFRDNHLSAKHSITNGITWFFSQEPEGIILEDDCVTDPSFFWFCEQLLNKYREHPKVMHIGASNFQEGQQRGNGNYYFSRYNHIWGWAGWRRSWQGYDVNFCNAPESEFKAILKSTFTRAKDIQYWLQIFRYLKSGYVDTWDTQYMFNLWKEGGYSITPNVNLVRNIGFGKEATNTHSPLSKWANLEPASIKQLVHPSKIKIDEDADMFTADHFYGVSESAKFFHLKIRLARYFPPSLKRKLRSLLRFV